MGSELSLKDKLIRALDKKKGIFKWTVDHLKCLKEVKQAIPDNIPLEPFDQSAKSIVSMDASKNGVGYGKVNIISCGSTGLTDAQTRYCIYNLKMAAMAFACTKLREYMCT